LTPPLERNGISLLGHIVSAGTLHRPRKIDTRTEFRLLDYHA
jgi:hypothetical protein